jgi:hypothetical protein
VGKIQIKMEALMKCSKKWIGLMLLLGFFSLSVGCATTGTTQAMTPKQVATVALNTYNQEYDNTMAVMTNPNSTPSQILIAQQKKVILTQMWPLLKIYTGTIDGGGTPSAQDTATLNSFIDQLTAFASSGK